MKANELRIGNLVTFNGKQIIVSWEDVQFIMTSDFEKEYHKPIPLTEEWLLKFGGYIFNGWDDMKFWRFDKKFSIYIFELEVLNDGFYYGETKVEFVHDLQNCYYHNYNHKKELNLAQ